MNENRVRLITENNTMPNVQLNILITGMDDEVDAIIIIEKAIEFALYRLDKDRKKIVLDFIQSKVLFGDGIK